MSRSWIRTTIRGMTILAVLAVIVVWRYAIKGKGSGAARAAALLSLVIVAWVLVAVNNARSADIAANGFAAGIWQAAIGLGKFLGHF